MNDITIIVPKAIQKILFVYLKTVEVEESDGNIDCSVFEFQGSPSLADPPSNQRGSVAKSSFSEAAFGYLKFIAS